MKIRAGTAKITSTKWASNLFPRRFIKHLAARSAIGFVLAAGLLFGQSVLPPSGPALILPNGVEVPAIPPEFIPSNGTFWSLQNPQEPPRPSLECFAIPDLPVYPLPDGSMVINDLEVD